MLATEKPKVLTSRMSTTTIETTKTEKETPIEKLQQVRRAGLFIGSVWAYGLKDGDTFTKAKALWTPTGYNVDSGRLAVSINEWGPVPINGAEQMVVGTGELERGQQLLMDIFETMANRGIIQMVAAPEVPPTYEDNLTAMLVERDATI